MHRFAIDEYGSLWAGRANLSLAMLIKEDVSLVSTSWAGTHRRLRQLGHWLYRSSIPLVEFVIGAFDVDKELGVTI